MMYTDKENEYAIELWESTARLFHKNTKKALSMLFRDEERPGQYSSHRRALKAARLERSRTGLIHHIGLTTYYLS